MPGMFKHKVFDKGEAWAYIYLLLIRGCGFTTNIFMQVALFSWAYGEVGCTRTGSEIGIFYNETTGLSRDQTKEEADEADDECAGKLYGYKIMGAYIAMQSVGMILSTISAPIIGSVVDHSANRRMYTLASTAIYILVNSIQIFATKNNWLLMNLLWQFPQRMAYELHKSCTAAYCTEVAEDEEQIIALQGAGRVSELLCMLGSLVVTMIGGGIMFEADEVGPKAVFGQVLASAISWPLLYLISSLLEDRPKLHEGEAHVCKVLGQLWKTMSDLRTTNRPVLQFLVGLAFLDAANSNIMTLLPVYAMQQLGVEDPSSLAGVVMLMCIPGAIITKKYQGKLGSRMCLQYIVLLNVVLTTMFVLFISKPGMLIYIVFVSVGYGLSLGGTFPAQKSLYMMIIPAGQEVEYQGHYSFYSQCLAWLPGIIFGLCVDAEIGGADNSRRIGMWVISAFHIVGMLLCSTCLDEKGAIEEAKKSAHLRIRGVKKVRGQAVVAPEEC